MVRTRDERRTEERRQEVARATWRTIAARGLEGASLRSIAREGGFTTGVLTYYFRNREEILLFAGRIVLSSLVRRLEQGLGGEQPLVALERALVRELPTTPETRLGWRIWLAFTARVPSDPAFAAEHEARYRDVRSLIRSALVAAAARGALAAAADVAEEADRVAAVFDGIGLHSILEPKRFPAARQRRLLVEPIRRLAAPPRSPARKKENR